MRERIPECFRGLARQGAPRGVGDRARDHHRHAVAPFADEFREQLLDSEDRRLRVQRVEDRLDQQQVRTAFEQTPGRVVIVVDERFEGDVAKARIIDVGRDRQRARRRPEHAGAEARLVRVLRRVRVAQLAHEAAAFDVDLVRAIAKTVFGLRHARAVEGVRLDDVRAGVEVGAVDAGNDIRARQHQQVVVALQVLRVRLETFAAVVRLAELVLLDHRAHRAIEDQDALGEESAEFFGAVGLHGSTSVVRVDHCETRRADAAKANGAANPADGLRAPLFGC